MTKFRKIACAALSVTMAGAIAASQVVAYANNGRINNPLSSATTGQVSFKEVTGSVNTSDVVKSQLSENVVDYGEKAETQYITGEYSDQTVIISLDVPSIVESKGTDMSVSEYLATEKGKRALKNITDSQDRLLKQLSASGISFKEVARYSSVINAVAVEVNTSQYSKITKVSGVSAAGLSQTYAPLAMPEAQNNPSNVYGTGIYNSTEIIEKYGYDGSGVTVAILDTGLDYTHEAFSHDPKVLGLTEDDVNEIINTSDGQGNPMLVAAQRTPGLTLNDVYLSDKVPFAYDYSDNDTDVYPSYSQHGTHVAGIVAGKADTYIDKNGNVIGDDEGEEGFSGVAPEAQLVICKVFTDDLNSEDLGGATSEDIVAALDDCVTLGVDIINMSLGTTSGFSSMRDEDVDGLGFELNRVYNNIKEAGISLISAAGNEYSSGFGSEFGTNLASNPDSGTVGSPSTYAGAMSVASINGQQAPYMLGNPDENSVYGASPVYYNESNDANSVPFDFAEEMLGAGVQSGTFTYLVIPGTGTSGDYSASVKRRLLPVAEGGLKQPNEKIIVVVRRGETSFQEKVETAQELYADGIIIYNNVPGTIRMSLGDIDEDRRIPAVSINMDAGAALTIDPNNPTRLRSEGTIEINKTYLAGPFMNDYSSWGATPDLKLKPDITAHGGEITSTVSGGYEEMSGTSMATPNLAGLMALVKNYLRQEHGLETNELTTLTNQIVMSSATLLYDEERLPYSPRKQGAGLATLSNIFTTKAYLSTDEQNGGAEDNRPKIELGEDEEKKGVYTFSFSVTNFGSSALEFTLVSRFMTETLSTNGLAVAEAAYMLDDIEPVFKVEGAAKDNGKIIVAGGTTADITVTLTLSDAEKKYLNDSFVNGMYVEGFISLVSETEGQCDLNLPFMGFYGDWEQAPMLDYNAYELAAIQQDTSLTDSQKPHESVFATQLVSTYYNGRYALPMGGYAYLQDENAEQVYVSEEHASVSRYNLFYGPTDTSNYLTSTGIRALYAGLLRNAELVTYDIYNVDTGEIIYQGRDYSVGKAYSGGGTAHPGLVDMKLDSETLGLVNNGKYQIEFNFYMKVEDEETMKGQNTFSSTFYADYDAPILQDTRIRYYDYQDGNKTKQRVYIDIDVYDNHYPQAVLLLYSDEDHNDDRTEAAKVNIATDYVTPVYNPVRNGTSTVSIEITDFYEEYKDRLYIQVDDYALNHSVYQIYFDEVANPANQGDDFNFVLNDRVTRTTVRPGQYEYNLTLEVNEMYRVELDCGTGNASNYTWATQREDLIKVKNNEVFGVRPGTARVDVTGISHDINGNVVDKTLTLNVTIVDSDRKLSMPTLSFGVIQGESKNLVVANGNVAVNAGQTFQLEVKPSDWYYPVENLEFQWTSSNENIATVDENGNVTTNNQRGTATIRATVLENGQPTQYAATVRLNVADPFDVSNMTLNHYYGSEEVVKIPDDKNIMYIGEEAFEDNDTMRVVIIPKTVVEISARAFLNCTALEEIYFIKETEEGDEPVADLAALNLILANAFMGCENLKLLDLTNVKVITVAEYAFAYTPIETIRHMEKIGITDEGAFYGCTKLKEIDITGLHTAGVGVFYGCTGLTSVKTAHYTAMGEAMFYGCTSLKEIEINNARVPGSAFEGCSSLESVTFGGTLEEKWNNTVFRIDNYAFFMCINLTEVDFNGYKVSSIGDYAFANTAITTFNMPAGDPFIGDGILDGTSATINWNGYSEEANGAVYNGTILVKAPAIIDSSFAIKEGTTDIGSYAFSGSKFNGVNTITIPASVETIGEGAFARIEGITTITIPASVTEIPKYAFMRSTLESIQIPAGIISIGEGAFAECRNLTEVTFAANSALKSIGDGAFSDTAITSIALPDGAATMGNMVFINCSELQTVTLPSVTSLGGYTFENCTSLESVTFGANATDSGIYTFFPGLKGYAPDEYGNLRPVYMDSALTTVVLSDKITELGEGVFDACVSLVSIDLKNITKIGAGAFAACSSLAEVINLDKVIEIGDIAFAEVALTTLNLASAKTVGAQAFINVEATSLNLSSVETIGMQAFAGININELQLPASLKALGNGAFMAAYNLRYITVDAGNSLFFAESNVLYRNITAAKTGNISYELCLYPAGRSGVSFSVKEGTSSIQAYAFAWLGEDSNLATVTLPYSVKLVGSSAFYGSPTITRYNFESIEAPRLLSEYYSTGLEEYGFYSLYYTNFYAEFLNFVPEMITDAYLSPLTIGYPSNGTGYDNYVFVRYFGNVVSLGELMDDNTRALIALLDGFDVEAIASWANIEVNAANKAMVTEFSEIVKTAHRMYNNIASAKQLEYLNTGADRVQKLSAVEDALKPIKQRFDILPNISTVSVAASSAHKSEYKVGDTFDLTGLVIEVVYDDYTTELISDLSGITLRSGSTGPLYSYTRFVDAEYRGTSFRIPVTVTAVEEEGPDNTGNGGNEGDGNGGGEDLQPEGGSNCSGCGTIDLGTTIGGTGLLLITMAGALLLVQRLRRRANRH